VLALYLAILASPFAIACGIGASRRASGFVARHYWGCIAVGWSAVALLAPAAVAFHGSNRVAALAIVSPPIALSFWRRAEGGDQPEPEPPGPDIPEIDWDQFRRDLDDWDRDRRPTPFAHR
jgi:hypothetical protein